MMKHSLALTALLLCAVTVSAQDVVPAVSADSVTQVAPQTPSQPQAKAARTFGYFSYNAVMQAMPEYAIAQKSIRDLKQTYDQELQRAERDFTQKYNEFLEGQKSFPENIMLKRQKELQQLMQQSVQFKNEAKELLAKAEKDLMEPIHNRLKSAIQSVGFENKYLYILNTDSNAYPYLSPEAEDCTTTILRKLGVE